MRRRDFLRGLLALPLAPVAAKLLHAPVHAANCQPCMAARVATIEEQNCGILEGMTGADQTSIWLVDWGEMSIYGVSPVPEFKYPDLFPPTRQWFSLQPKRNWFKEKINGV